MFGILERMAYSPLYDCYAYFIRLLDEHNKAEENDIMVARELQVRAYPMCTATGDLAIGDRVHVHGSGDNRYSGNATRIANIPYLPGRRRETREC